MNKRGSTQNLALTSFIFSFVYFCLLLLGDFIVTGKSFFVILFDFAIFLAFIVGVAIGIVAILNANKKDIGDKVFALCGITLPFIFTLIMLAIEKGSL